ncbi:MAG: alpha/beta fold hydrolase [Patescibacteria group bacterium]|nr:alpha/beta fold hydrolase [Patescibacteria group bacterium]
MKRVFIIHGWGGSGGEGWQAWLKDELEEKGFEVYAPDMPDTENPDIEAWVSTLAKLVGKCDEKTFFVGHSVGCQTILRYLAELPEGEKAGGAVFAAGWFNLKGLTFQEEEIAMPWLRLPIDLEKVKTKTTKFFAVFSDNDPVVPLSDEELFKENLGAETAVLKDKEHFTGETDINELPIVLEKLLAMAK